MQIAGLAAHPNEVDTALLAKPSGAKRRQNACSRLMRGRSSATITQVRILKQNEIEFIEHLFDFILYFEFSFYHLKKETTHVDKLTPRSFIAATCAANSRTLFSTTA